MPREHCRWRLSSGRFPSELRIRPGSGLGTLRRLLAPCRAQCTRFGHEQTDDETDGCKYETEKEDDRNRIGEREAHGREGRLVEAVAGGAEGRVAVFQAQ